MDTNSKTDQVPTKESFDPNKKHPSHKTRFSMDASTYDEICKNCGHTDMVPGGWGKLAEPCPSPDGIKKHE